MMLTVRKLQHPVAVFMTAVLIVIGAGVGIVAGTTNQKLYGPSWGRFSVSFSGLVNEQGKVPLLTVLPSDAIVTAPNAVAVLSYGDFTGWTGYQPLHVVALDTVLVESIPQARMASAVQQMLRVVKRGFLSLPVTDALPQANGFRVIAIGPQCVRSLCQGALLVSKGQTLWVLSASSPGQKNKVEDFLDSFQPIG